MTQKDAKAALISGGFTKVIAKRDGTLEVRRSYFYRGGLTTDAIERKVLSILPRATVVSATDQWNPWPKDSYFSVVISVP